MSNTSPIQPLYDARSKLQRQLEALDFVIGQYESGEWVLETPPIVEQPVNSRKEYYPHAERQEFILQALGTGPMHTVEIWDLLRERMPQLDYHVLYQQLKKMVKDGMLQSDVSSSDRRRRMYSRVAFLSKAI